MIKSIYTICYFFLICISCNSSQVFDIQIEKINKEQTFEYLPKQGTTILMISIKGNIDCSPSIDIYLDSLYQEPYQQIFLKKESIDTLIRSDWYDNKLFSKYVPDKCNNGNLDIQYRFY